MCLAIPAKVISIEDMIARVDMMGNERSVGTHLVPEVKIGDYVLIHAGFAIEILENEVAKETVEIFEEIFTKEEEFYHEGSNEKPTR